MFLILPLIMHKDGCLCKNVDNDGTENNCFRSEIDHEQYFLNFDSFTFVLYLFPV